MFILIYSLELINTWHEMAVREWKMQCFLYTLSKLSEITQANNSNGVNSGEY